MLSSFAQVSGDDDNYIDDVFLCFHSAGDGYAVSEHESFGGCWWSCCGGVLVVMVKMVMAMMDDDVHDEFYHIGHHDEDEDVVNDSDGDGDVIRVSTLVRIRVVKAALATKANITTQIVRLVITSAV